MTKYEKTETPSDGPASVELYVDDTICVGMGRCEVVEPNVFEIDDDAISQIVGAANFTEDRAKAVMFECPTGAIKSRALLAGHD